MSHCNFFLDLSHIPSQHTRTAKVEVTAETELLTSTTRTHLNANGNFEIALAGILPGLLSFLCDVVVRDEHRARRAHHRAAAVCGARPAGVAQVPL